MGRFRAIAVLLMLLVLSAACCPMLSEHPLSGKPDIDLPLTGAWKFDSPEKNAILLHVYKTTNGHFILHYIADKGEGTTETFTVPFFLTNMGDTVYANIDIGKALENPFAEADGYFFVKIVPLEADTIQVSALAQQPVKAAIESGRLKGDIQKKGAHDERPPEGKVCYLPQMAVTCVRMTDTSENLRKFLITNSSGRLFPEVLTFRRIKD